MKRVAVLLGMTAATPGVVWAQVPTTTPAPATAPVTKAPPSVTKPPPSAAPASPSAPPGPAGATDSAPAAPPGDQYYVEPPSAAGEAKPAEPDSELAGRSSFEPPPPGRPIYEPPPPPQPSHLAPKMAIWVGARLGWFFPFGNLWSDALIQSNSSYLLEGRPWADFAASGPMFELDVGARLSRSYTVFVLWERAQLSSGSDTLTEGEQDGGDTDFWALGLRASSDPDRIGFITEVALGFRRARTLFADGTEYQFTEAPFEARLGLGAEFRLSRMITLSPMATVGVGAFGNLQKVDANGRVSPLAVGLDQNDGHAWATLMVGGHFDLLPSAN